MPEQVHKTDEVFGISREVPLNYVSRPAVDDRFIESLTRDRHSAGLQVKKDIKPIVLDYDQTNLRLNVVDRGFLIWLRHQDRKALLEMVGLPAT